MFHNVLAAWHIIYHLWYCIYIGCFCLLVPIPGDSIPHLQGIKKKALRVGGRLGVCERGIESFSFCESCYVLSILRCLGINSISERLNIFHLFKIPLVGKMVGKKFLSPFPTFWMPTLRWLLLIAPFTGGRDGLGSRRTGQSCTCGAGADLNLGMKRWGQMKMRDQTLQFFWYVFEDSVWMTYLWYLESRISSYVFCHDVMSTIM